jgi:hypothetical protein
MKICYVFRRIDTKLVNKVKKFNAEVDSMQNQMPFLWLWWVKIACHYINLANNADTMCISQNF